MKHILRIVLLPVGLLVSVLIAGLAFCSELKDLMVDYWRLF